MSGPEVASYAQLLAVIARLEAELGPAQERIAELEARLGQNPRNSSKPPSSEGLAKPAPRSLRRRSGRKPGSQPGHPGSTLAPVAVPDEVVRHDPRSCRGCGQSLAGAPQLGVEQRQEFDIPPIVVRVREHQLIEWRCSWGRVSCGQAPEGIDAPVQYGPRITAIIVYLYVGQFVSKKRTAQALAELFGTPLSEGTVAAMTHRAAQGLGEFTAGVTDRLAEADVVGVEETGLRVQGRLPWVHCARTEKYTLVGCHPKRGTAGIDYLGVLGRLPGVVVHDAGAPSDTYLDPDHQLCCAHALRELQAVTDTAPEGDWCWATQAAGALVAMQQLLTAAWEAGHHSVEAGVLDEQVRSWRSAALIGISQTAARSTKLMKKHHALARRLLERQDDYLRFTTDWRAPQTTTALNATSA